MSIIQSLPIKHPPELFFCSKLKKPSLASFLLGQAQNKDKPQLIHVETEWTRLKSVSLIIYLSSSQTKLSLDPGSWKCPAFTPASAKTCLHRAALKLLISATSSFCSLVRLPLCSVFSLIWALLPLDISPLKASIRTGSDSSSRSQFLRGPLQNHLPRMLVDIFRLF